MMLTGLTRTAFIAFFASHIPITILLDSQAVLPPQLYPQFFKDAVQWYADTFHDKLFAPPFDNIFFQSFIACELLFQLPFFIVALYALITKSVDGRGWFRSACLVYGAHTATTLIPILISIAGEKETTSSQKAVLFSFYMPYLIFPVWLMLIALQEEDVFGGEKGSQETTSKKD